MTATIHTKRLTGYEVPALRVNLLPVSVALGSVNGNTTLGQWNIRVRRWHRTGGRLA
jgi:hypothetical protein